MYGKAVVTAFDKEMNNMEPHKALNFDEVMEYNDIMQRFPDALIVEMRPVLGEKFAELNLLEGQKLYKVRIVLQCQCNWCA